MDIRFAYIKDPENQKRVVTIGYAIDGNRIIFDVTVNKVVEPLLLDPWLREVIGNEAFQDIQERCKRKFKGDPHRKRIARAILTGRVGTISCFQLPYEHEERPPNRSAIVRKIIDFLAGGDTTINRISVVIDVLRRHLEYATDTEVSV